MVLAKLKTKFLLFSFLFLFLINSLGMINASENLTIVPDENCITGEMGVLNIYSKQVIIDFKVQNNTLNKPILIMNTSEHYLMKMNYSEENLLDASFFIDGVEHKRKIYFNCSQEKISIKAIDFLNNKLNSTVDKIENSSLDIGEFLLIILITASILVVVVVVMKIL